jgi:hypothetical protein
MALEQCAYTAQGEYSCNRSHPRVVRRETFFAPSISSAAECSAFCTSNGGTGQYGNNNTCKCVQKAKDLPVTCINFQCNKGRNCKCMDNQPTTGKGKNSDSSAKVSSLLR